GPVLSLSRNCSFGCPAEGDFGAAGGGGGGVGRGGAAAGGGGGGVGRGGGAAAGGGGAGRGGAAAGGGAAGGAAFGAAAGGAPLGASLLGLPSGPSSSFACAITSGAVCACDGELANCIAVRAVVASSTRRRFVMMISVPENLGDESVVLPSVSASQSTASH